MAFGNRIVLENAVAPAGARLIDMDELDRAAIACDGLVSFARAKKRSAVNVGSNFQDRMLQNIAVNGTAKTFTAADALLNNRATVLQDGNGAVPYKISDLAIPASWTFAAVVRTGALKNGNHILTVHGSSVQYLVAGLVNGSVSIQSVDEAGQTTILPTGAMASNTSMFLFVSYDAATKTHRMGVNTLSGGSFVAVNPFPESAGGDAFYPFGRGDLNTNHFTCRWSMFGVWQNAYGTGGDFDSQFAGLFSAATSYYAL